MVLNSNRSYSKLLLICITLLTVVTIACRASSDTPIVSESVSPQPKATDSPVHDSHTEYTETPEISWNEAMDYVGINVIVCGPVMDTKWADSSNGKPTFLNLGKSYPEPDRFTVIIWEDYRSNFPEPPEEVYSGKTICISGEVEEYKGSPQIEVRYPSQIEIQ